MKMNISAKTTTGAIALFAAAAILLSACSTEAQSQVVPSAGGPQATGVLYPGVGSPRPPPLESSPKEPRP